MISRVTIDDTFDKTYLEKQPQLERFLLTKGLLRQAVMTALIAKPYIMVLRASSICSQLGKSDIR